ncbi:hypothetical protein KAW65_01320 [candidate division WOR-3 bacterium]|nr:hypothetical protein [candidate division WOR-3 bacterium]
MGFDPSADGLEFGILKDMILTKPNPWGIITGKLKIKPQDALKLFGFEMNKDEKYILFKKFKKHNIVYHHTKQRNPKTKSQQKNRNLFAILVKIAKQNLNSLIKPAWNPLAKNLPASGFDLFVGENIKRVTKDESWSNMLVTKGKIQKPHLSYAKFFYLSKKIVLGIKNENNYKIGICILNTKDYILYHIKPAYYKNSNHTCPPSVRRIVMPIPKTLKKPVVFAYFINGNNYSNSIARVPKVFRNETTD